MPTDQHAQQPDGDSPPPCDCGGCREFLSIHAGHCAEVPLHERAAAALEARDRNTVLATWHGCVERPLRAA